MNHPPYSTPVATCDEGLDFYPFIKSEPDPGVVVELPNHCDMGVVTLGEDGTFLSSRPLTQAELAVAWAEHFARRTLSRRNRTGS